MLVSEPVSVTFEKIAIEKSMHECFLLFLPPSPRRPPKGKIGEYFSKQRTVWKQNVINVRILGYVATRHAETFFYISSELDYK